MEQITITIKVQIIPNDTDKLFLRSTMIAYKKACNYVSDYIFKTHNLKHSSLNKALYSNLRNKFELKSQMAQSVLKTVVSKYKSILENQNKWIKPNFKKPQYDLVWNRDYSLKLNYFSINTLYGRIKLSYFEKGISKYFNHNIYKFGTAKLINKHGKYFLYIPVTYEVEECFKSEICNVVGIDRGINFIITTYDSNHKTVFFDGKFIKNRRINYSELRRKLQIRKTSSSRKRLKAIGNRENRWIQDVNHKVSKALIESNPKCTLFVLEDLKGIQSATKRVRKKYRYVTVS